MSDSVRPHGLQPTRPLHPWDFPGEVLEWGASAFSSIAHEVTQIPAAKCAKVIIFLCKVCCVPGDSPRRFSSTDGSAIQAPGFLSSQQTASMLSSQQRASMLSSQQTAPMFSSQQTASMFSSQQTASMFSTQAEMRKTGQSWEDYSLPSVERNTSTYVHWP